MLNHTEINQLLHSRQPANNALAFELLKGQDYREIDALMYMLDYHISQFWELPTQEWVLEFPNTKFKLYIFEDQDAYVMDNQVDLVCNITSHQTKISQRKDLGYFEYNIWDVEPDSSSPTLFNFKDEARSIFQASVIEWLA